MAAVHFHINFYNLTLYRKIPLALITTCFSLPLPAQNFTPLRFEENKGQWNNQVLFRASSTGGSIFLRSTGFTYSLYNLNDIAQVENLVHPGKSGVKQRKDDALPTSRDYQSNAASGLADNDDAGTGLPPAVTVHGHAYEVNFMRANPHPQVVPDKPVNEYANYFIGNDPSKWAAHVRAYQAVTYKNMYRNVDVRVYSEASQLKYDLIVFPGGNPDEVELEYKGAHKMEIKKGNLSVQTSVGETLELIPLSYQIINNQRVEVPCQYKLSGNKVKFSLPRKYDKNYPLVIDPNIILATFTGSKGDNWGFTATYDAQGNFYAGGIIFGATGTYPTTLGAFQTSFGGGTQDNGGFDMAISKFDPYGTTLIYSTYLGGADNEQPHSLIVDAKGELIIAGRTRSNDYPLYPLNNKVGPNGGFDIVITKLNSSGTGLIGSIRIGGSGNDGVNIGDEYSAPSGRSLKRNYGDDARSEVIVDTADNIYLASCTQSDNFPVTPGVFQPTRTAKGSQQDGVVIKCPPNLSGITWASLLGGSADDAAYVLKVNARGNLYVAGATGSSNFPTTSGVIYPAYRGVIDGFIAEITNDGRSLIQSTYLGVNAADEIYGIELDANGYVYVMGTTEGNWPIVNALYNEPGARQFIAKLQPDLSAFVYSTTFGGSSTLPKISPVAFLVDRCENVYVSGWGGSLNVRQGFATDQKGTLGMPVKDNPPLFATTDGSDFYFFVLKKDAVAQLFGAFWGDKGSEIGDHVDGGTSRFDRNGVIYQAICSCASPNIPTLPGAYATQNGTRRTSTTAGCNLYALKIAFNLDGVKAGIQTADRRSNYCVPATVTFIDTTRVPAQSWEWNFGDGSPAVTGTNDTIAHTFTTAGIFKVRLVKYDPQSCNLRDTAYYTVNIRNDRASIGFNAQRLPPCTNLNYQFNNTSTAPTGKPFGSRSFVWDYGDNSPFDTTGSTPRVHQYAQEGVYKVKLTLIDTGYCNAPQTDSQVIRIATNVKAGFSVPDSGCAPYLAQFTNTSTGGASFEWNFGEPKSGGANQSTDVNPQHKYNVPGTYTITLVANDPNTCNKTDTLRRTISVFPPPVASFTFGPNPPQENVAIKFTNQSVGAVTYLWNFGDGKTATEMNPQHIFPKTGTYNVCLTAANQYGCTDVVCQPVSAIIVPGFDIPSAFSPNGDGINDIFKIRGFGIVKFDLKVYNRWGQLVFESTDPEQGWDGKFKGTLQPMDAYAYAVNLEFSDGQKLNKSGSVTLLR